MNLKQHNIAAAKALGLAILNTDFSDCIQVLINGEDRLFSLNDPAYVNMVIEHFKIDVISYNDRKDGLIWVAATTDGEYSGEDTDRDTAIMKCVEKCLEGV